jgi:heterodisulfide reductase subunit A-like polyferredoxin
VAGACTGPKTIPETLADARAAVVAIDEYMRSGNEPKNLKEAIIEIVRNRRKKVRTEE